MLERVRERLADRITIAAVPTFTISFGLASSDQGSDFDHVVSLADAALLNAKAAGRDQIVVSDGPAPPTANPAAASVRLEPRPRTSSGAGAADAGTPIREHQHN